jgi:hypothetical protein
MKLRILFFFASFQLIGQSFYDTRTAISSPLLFKTGNSREDDFFSLSYSVGSIFNSKKIAEKFTMNNKPYFTLNEQGATTTSEYVLADMNPLMIGLTDHTVGLLANGSYRGSIELFPKLINQELLVHFYKQFQKFFIDARSALKICRSGIEIVETSQSLGAHAGLETFAHAMQNEKWLYGKMGMLKKKCGIDNIQIKIGKNNIFYSESESENKPLVSHYILLEIPTGKGTKSEWVFEPRVGKNHLAFGLGSDISWGDKKGQLFLSGDIRYFLGAQETRSFDTIKNGSWSRYLPTVFIPSSTGIHKSRSGINFFTRTATVFPGAQIICSFRWAKEWNDLNIECGSHFFCKSKERISNVADYKDTFGIYDIYSNNGQTASSLTINSLKPASEISQIESLTSDLDIESAISQIQVVTGIGLKLEKIKDDTHFGLGAIIEIGHSESAYSSWNVYLHSKFVF